MNYVLLGKGIGETIHMGKGIGEIIHMGKGIREIIHMGKSKYCLNEAFYVELMLLGLFPPPFFLLLFCFVFPFVLFVMLPVFFL